MDINNILAILGLIVHLVTADFTARPKNAAVLIGESTRLQCSSTKDYPFIGWSEKLVGDTAFEAITYLDGQLLPEYNQLKYVVDKTNDRFDLLPPINATSQAGDYRCREINPTKDALAKLTVMETAPKCSASTSEPLLENEEITYTCQVNYQGDLFPKMQWSTDIASIDPTVDDSIDGNRTKVSIKVVADSSKNMKTYSCLTYFNAPTSPGEDYDRSAPDYDYKYESPQLVVHWSPRNPKIEPVKEQYYPDEKIRCSAESNPSVSYYTWYDIRNVGNNVTEDIIQEGPDKDTMTISAAWLDRGLVTLRCAARNDMRDGPATASVNVTFGVFTTTVPPTTTTTTTIPPTTVPLGSSTDNTGASGSRKDTPPGLNTGAIVGIAIGCCLIAIIILLLLYCFCIKKRTSKEEEANNTRPQKPVPHDQVRTLNTKDLATGPYDPNPPPYNAQFTTENPYARRDPRSLNAENLVYADLALDDTPRSRKPIQLPTDLEGTLYADVAPGPMV